MINRDISWDGPGSGYYIAEEVDKHQALVKDRCPKAFLKSVEFGFHGIK